MHERYHFPVKTGRLKMKSILRCLVILLLLVAALPLIVYAGSSNVTSAVVASDTPIATVTASSGWIVTPASIGYVPQTISSLFTCVFGVRIFPNADPVGTYSINDNPHYVPDGMSGKVSGHMYIGPAGFSVPGMVFYLGDPNNGRSSSYFAITDNQGYYEIDHVPFGNYSVFVCNDVETMHASNGEFVNYINLTASNPDAVVDWRVMPE